MPLEDGGQGLTTRAFVYIQYNTEFYSHKIRQIYRKWQNVTDRLTDRCTVARTTVYRAVHALHADAR